jgi:hypothetical protein
VVNRAFDQLEMTLAAALHGQNQAIRAERQDIASTNQP